MQGGKKKKTNAAFSVLFPVYWRDLFTGKKVQVELNGLVPSRLLLAVFLIITGFILVHGKQKTSAWRGRS